jgi:hypothetical protein
MAYTSTLTGVQIDGALVNSVKGVGTVADLRDMTGESENLTVKLLGYYAEGDGGGGPVRYWVDGESAGTYVDNGFSIIVPTGGDGSGAWVWDWSGPVNALWAGALGDGTEDNMDIFDTLVEFSHTARLPIYVPAGTYLMKGLDFVGRDYAVIYGEKNIEYGASILKTTGTANITVDSKTVFIRINDKSATGPLIGASVRSISMSNLQVVEAATSLRNRGILSTYTPQLEIENVTVYGFDYSVRAANLWNSRISNLHMYYFRTSGLSMSEADANFENANGLELLSAHASSTESPDVNFDVRGANSTTFMNLTTEGTCTSHFMVNAGTKSVNIHGIHLEGGTNVIEVRVDENSPTQNFCDFSIFGGLISQPNITDAGARFILPVGSAAVGLRSLTMKALTILKRTTPEEYYSLNKVANLDTTASFLYHATASIDALTWKNVGLALNGNQPKSQIGHNGIMTTSSKPVACVYNGYPGGGRYREVVSAANMLAGRTVAIIPHLAKEKLLEIDVELLYNAAGLENDVFFARFIGHIAYDGTLILGAAAYSQGPYALNVTFTYASSTGALVATSLVGLGTWYVRTNCTPLF